FQKLVLSIAGDYSGPPFEERVAAGWLGFWKAFDRYNHLRNSRARLGTYARYFIKAAISDCVLKWRKGGEAGETRLERSVRANIARWPFKPSKYADGKLRDKWPYKHNGLVLTAPDMVEVLGCSLKEAERALQKYENRGQGLSYNTTDESKTPKSSFMPGWSCF